MMAASNDSWRDCVQWLTRCEVLRPDHKANWPEATVVELANTLRDGVVLCNLLNTLDPGCIDMKDVNQKPQLAQFLCLRNIRTFLQACRDIFGLKECDLFEPGMLFELSDFYKVLNTLSKLSYCPRAQKTNVPPFYIQKHRHSSQEDIYRNLNSTNDEASSHVRDEEDEYGEYSRIYEDLCSITNRMEVEDLSTTAHSLEKRDYVIKELVETEKNYVDVLSTIQRCFIKPLNSFLYPEHIKDIFGGIKEMAEIHSGFHSHLLKAVTPNSSVKLSDVFINWREKFLIYGEYCAKLTNAQELIQELCAKSEVINQEIIKCQREANNGKFKLRDILSVPMQRILKYPLLLDKLIKETQPGHDDYQGLKRAKEAMIDVAQYINEVKRDSDTLAIINSIQESILDLDMPENTKLKDYGRLLKDGELKIRAHDDNKTKTRYIFVFDQVMIMCKATKGDTYSYRDSLRLQDYKVEDVSNRRTLRSDGRWNYQFYLVRKSERTAFTLAAKSEDSKRKWIKAISDAMDNIEPAGCRKTNHKFHICTFDKPTTCNHCSKFLKGIILQGYRCDHCDIPVHKQCIEVSGRCGAPPLPPPRPVHRPPPPLPDTWPDPNLRDQLWFVGEMGRDRATTLLERHVDGTFLLRIRPQGATHPNETIYALSLKTNNRVKHMKVYEKEMEGITHYYLSESRFFRSIMDLISCYERASLGENFVGLDVMLKWPFRQIIAIAEFDFRPTEQNQLPLRKGCHVIILSKEGDYKGWWKGKFEDKIGFFPKDYVREIQETTRDNIIT